MKVSFGTFRSLKPFYIKSTDSKDMEMCCCKTHVHARCSLKALFECCGKQNIELPFSDYYSFFEYVTADCEWEDGTHISWDCVPSKDECYTHIRDRWDSIESDILLKSDNAVTVKLL